MTIHGLTIIAIIILILCIVGWIGVLVECGYQDDGWD